MRPIMILAGYQIIRKLSRRSMDITELYLYYIEEEDCQKLLDEMLNRKIIHSEFKGKHSILLYKGHWRSLKIYKDAFETDEFRQWVKKAEAILLDLSAEVLDMFNVEEIKLRYCCSEEEVKFYMQYFYFCNKIVAIPNSKFWKIRRSIWNRLRELVK